MKLLDWFPAFFLLWGAATPFLMKLNDWFVGIAVAVYLVLIIWYQKELDRFVGNSVAGGGA